MLERNPQWSMHESLCRDRLDNGERVIMSTFVHNFQGIVEENVPDADDDLIRQRIHKEA